MFDDEILPVRVSGGGYKAAACMVDTDGHAEKEKRAGEGEAALMDHACLDRSLRMCVCPGRRVFECRKVSIDLSGKVRHCFFTRALPRPVLTLVDLEGREEGGWACFVDAVAEGRRSGCCGGAIVKSAKSATRTGPGDEAITQTSIRARARNVSAASRGGSWVRSSKTDPTTSALDSF